MVSSSHENAPQVQDGEEMKVSGDPGQRRLNVLLGTFGHRKREHAWLFILLMSQCVSSLALPRPGWDLPCTRKAARAGSSTVLGIAAELRAPAPEFQPGTSFRVGAQSPLQGPPAACLPTCWRSSWAGHGSTPVELHKLRARGKCGGPASTQGTEAVQRVGVPLSPNSSLAPNRCSGE